MKNNDLAIAFAIFSKYEPGTSSGWAHNGILLMGLKNQSAMTKIDFDCVKQCGFDYDDINNLWITTL